MRRFQGAQFNVRWATLRASPLILNVRQRQFIILFFIWLWFGKSLQKKKTKNTVNPMKIKHRQWQ